MPMKPQPARGVVETWGLPPVYRAGGARTFPQNSETFFSDRGEGVGLNEEDRSDVHC
jgi:hypothetical protein